MMLCARCGGGGGGRDLGVCGRCNRAGDVFYTVREVGSETAVPTGDAEPVLAAPAEGGSGE